jgi:hypothetical protein
MPKNKMAADHLKTGRFVRFGMALAIGKPEPVSGIRVSGFRIPTVHILP